jgi:hypothetical protein
MAQSRFVRLIFEVSYNAYDEVDAFQRGYRSHVWVELNDGSHHRVNFFDPDLVLSENMSRRILPRFGGDAEA